MKRGWYVDPAARTHSAIDTQPPRLSREQWEVMGTPGAASGTIARGLPVIEAEEARMQRDRPTALRSDTEKAKALLTDPAIRLALLYTTPYTLIRKSAESQKFNFMEHITAAKILKPSMFEHDMIEALYSVAQTPLTFRLHESVSGGAQSSTADASRLPDGHTIHMWSLDKLTNTDIVQMEGAYYRVPPDLAQYFPGPTLLLLRNAAGEVVDFPPEHLPGIEYKSIRSSKSRATKTFYTQTGTMQDGKMMIEEAPVYTCYTCQSELEDTTIRCLCGSIGYCSVEHQCERLHCGACVVCGQTTPKRCECQHAWYCRKECQREDWLVHADEHRRIMLQKLGNRRR